MAAKFGYVPEGLEYCRTTRPLPPTASRPAEPARTYPIGSRINPQAAAAAAAADTDSDKEKARRRIAVAVWPCSCFSDVQPKDIDLTAYSARDVESARSNVLAI